MRDFRPIEESVHLIPSSVPDLPQLIQEIQERLESFEGLLQQDDVERLIRCAVVESNSFGLYACLMAIVTWAWNWKSMPLPVAVWADAPLPLWKSQVLLLVHDFLTSRGVEIGHLSASDKPRRKKSKRTEAEEKPSLGPLEAIGWLFRLLWHQKVQVSCVQGECEDMGSVMLVDAVRSFLLPLWNAFEHQKQQIRPAQVRHFFRQKNPWEKMVPSGKLT